MDTVVTGILIKPSQVKDFLGCDVDKACILSTAFNKVFPAYGITTPLRVQHSISQMAHESINFSAKSENLNYSARALVATWPTRFNDTTALKYARQPQLIAEKVYNGRMGNTKPDDGWLFRGAGYIQITGKEMFEAYAKYKGFSDPYKTADLVRLNDEYALDSACWFLTKIKVLLDDMDRDDVVTVTKRINGGTIGLADRKALLAKAKRIFI